MLNLWSFFSTWKIFKNHGSAKNIYEIQNLFDIIHSLIDLLIDVIDESVGEVQRILE